MSRRLAVTALLLLLAVAPAVIAQSGGSQATGSTPAATQPPTVSTSSAAGGAAPSEVKPAGPAAAKETQQARSLLELRSETLRYGIDSQILDLLKTLTDEKTKELDPEIATLIAQSANTDVQTAAINYLDLVKDWRAADAVRSILSDYAGGGGEPENLAISAITYLQDAHDAQAAKLFAQLVTDTSKSVAGAAIRAIGKSGDAGQTAALVADLKSTDFSAELKPEIVLALGDLKAKEAVPELTKILENQDADLVLREYACDALGKIAEPESLPLILKTYRDKNSYLRAYAVSSLRNYSGEQVDTLLIQALRDDFWRVRVGAAQSLGAKKVSQAVPVLEYKAHYDPEPNVQKAAVTALGEIGSAAAYAFLQTLYANELASPTIRLAALDSLVENDLSGSLATIESVIDKMWSTAPSSPFLDYTCMKLSQAKDPALSALFVRFLSGPTVNIKIYGIRGIVNNHLVNLRKEIEPLSSAATPLFIRRVALSALSELK